MSVGDREPLLVTAGTRTLVESLAWRTAILEEAMRELTVAVQVLAQSPGSRD